MNGFTATDSRRVEFDCGFCKASESIECNFSGSNKGVWEFYFITIFRKYGKFMGCIV